MDIKKQLYQYCEDFVEKRFSAINTTIEELQKALSSETKSTAGDKHETGRAMVQLEREKAGQQLAEIQKIKQTLQLIDVNKQSNIVCLGSVVYTNRANYFLSVSAGEIHIDKELFYAISLNTPIGKLLLSKTAGDVFNFNGKDFKIANVL